MIYNDKICFLNIHMLYSGWLYFDKDGIAVTGLQQVWGEYYYFRDAAGLPNKSSGEKIVDYKGHKLYFDPKQWSKCGVIVMPILWKKIIILMKNGYLTEI